MITNLTNKSLIRFKEKTREKYMGMFDPEDDSALTACKTVIENEDVLERIQEHALDVVLLQQRYKAAKEALDAATEGLAMSLPPAMREVGEHAVTTDKLLVLTLVSEKLTWDQDLMAEVYLNDKDLPDGFTAKFGMTKTRYDKASQSDRDSLAQALTRSASKPKFKIEAI